MRHVSYLGPYAVYGALTVLALALTSPAVAQLPGDGFWTAQGRAVPGTRCADWLVRLAVEQGRLTGVVGVGQGNVLLQNLMLRPDGSFSGNTVPGHLNNRAVRAYNVTGRFSGDMVTVTLASEICPDRTATGWRRGFGY